MILASDTSPAANALSSEGRAFLGILSRSFASRLASSRSDTGFSLASRGLVTTPVVGFSALGIASFPLTLTEQSLRHSISSLTALVECWGSGQLTVMSGPAPRRSGDPPRPSAGSASAASPASAKSRAIGIAPARLHFLLEAPPAATALR